MNSLIFMKLFLTFPFATYAFLLLVRTARISALGSPPTTAAEEDDEGTVEEDAEAVELERDGTGGGLNGAAAERIEGSAEWVAGAGT
ncbi:hypothetical protein WR25_06361 [Diploscapter pachys]|uniref:Uncharacterized protein n=1 Tax=Diploscapter pachys TaxID=2018661 RepID=A0A2A2KM32_9BILA|nr:hypothetical protein WR25_06361 [Diploscapter pachys]